MQIPLTEPQEIFAFSDNPHPALCGGLGCVHPDTKIWTEHGLMRISEIDRPMRVLSWNETGQRFQLSLSSGAYMKGRGYLREVITKNGLSRVAEHHQLFSSSRKYVQAQDLSFYHALATAEPYQLPTILESALLSSRVDDQHSCETILNYLGGYADECRQYGQQLPTGEVCDLSSLPLQGDALKYARIDELSAFLRKDDQEELLQVHTHHGQSHGRQNKTGCSHQSLGLEEVEGNQKPALFSGRIWHYLHKVKQSLSMFFSHRKNGLSSPGDRLEFSLGSTCCVGALVEEDIQDYWDIQVLDTNNYICENGLIHHNSGKSEAGIMRLILLMLENYSISQNPINTLLTFPTYDLCKLRGMTGVEEVLTRLGMEFKTNKAEFSTTIGSIGTILYRSYDRPERIVAFECAHSICDELDTLRKEKAEIVWRKVNERTRQETIRPNSVAAVTTPDQGIHGFMYKKWVKDRLEGYELIKAPTYSNPYLPAGYIDQIRANYDPILADLYIEGEFVSLSDSKVYHFFDRNTHDSDRVIKKGERLHIGLDFNVGGCCANVWVSHDTHDFVNNLTRYDGNQITVYPDSSGGSNSTNATATDIQIIKQSRASVDCPNKNPFVRDRVNSVNALLSHGKMFVNCTKCPELAFALESQGYTDKGDPEKFNDHPALDDWNDATGYFINRKFPVSRPVSNTGIGMAF